MYLKDFHIMVNNYQIQILRLTKKLKNCSLHVYYGGRSWEVSINKWRTTNISWRRGNILVSELTFFHLRFLSYGSGECYFFNSWLNGLSVYYGMMMTDLQSIPISNLLSTLWKCAKCRGKEHLHNQTNHLETIILQ